MKKTAFYILTACVSGACFFSSPGVAAARGRSGAVRKSAAPLGGAKRRVEIPSSLMPGEPQERDPSLLLSLDSLDELLETSRPVLIDVRNKEDYKALRIPGSMNMPLFALKTKPFLRGEKVVLVDEGFRYKELEQECRRLRKSGFKELYILDGGMNGWARRGKILEGDVFKIPALSRVSPRAFFLERNYRHWVVINLAEEEGAERFLSRWVVRRPLEGGEEDFSGAVRKLVQGESPESTFFLFCDRDGTSYNDVERYLKETEGLQNVFYLEGGLEGYKKFLQEQMLIWQSRKKSSDPDRKCKSCS